MGGALTIDAGDGTFTLTDSRAKPTRRLNTVRNGNAEFNVPSLTTEIKAFVSQESSLFFKGRNIVTKSVDNRQRDYRSRH